ncbi:MAG: ribbon-helix-helix protein, CopG family [Acidimicrobiales bacterium]|nr:ribbon-helix-helix protein, CopG family [Acidimicrobiales bacterium]
MTMLSFRLDEATAARAAAWAARLEIDRSELLREALRLHLLRLDSERDAETWVTIPLDAGESTLAAVADWGPAEDWADWADATG